MKIQVGNVCVDGKDIRIDTDASPGSAASDGYSISLQQEIPVAQPGSNLVEKVRLPPWALLMGGFGLLGTAAMVLVTMTGMTVIAFAPAAVAAITGLGAVGLGFMRRRLLAVKNNEASREQQQLQKLRLEELLPYLTQGDGSTVETLMEKTGMTEAAVITTLHHEISSGQVIEDLMLSSGEWYYYLSPEYPLEPVAAKHLPVSDRIKKEMESQNEG